MQKKQMVVGEHYAVSFGYGMGRLGEDYGLDRGRLVRFHGSNAIFERVHEKSGRRRQGFEPQTVALHKVPGTWQQHLDVKAERAERRAESQKRAEAEVAARAEGKKTLDEVLGQGWGKKFHLSAPLYSTDSWYLPKVDEGRYGPQACGRSAEVTTAELAALVEAAYEAGRESVLESQALAEADGQ